MYLKHTSGDYVFNIAQWFKGQTWSEFLMETLSVMLGQLTINIGAQRADEDSQDQEVFVVGFHGFYFHVAHGFFTKTLVSRVHAKGCSENESFSLRFTQGYNLWLKEDWLEATRALARLFRYLLSGRAKVGAIQAS
jgi:hypothetical protein